MDDLPAGAVAVPVEVAIAGDAAAADTLVLIDAARGNYLPHRLLAVGHGAVPELLAHREQIGGRATAYVCCNRVCKPPVTDPEALRAQLEPH